MAINNRTNGNYECLPVEIGDDVFIGSDVKILKGVKIGQGAVIANGAIVVKDVPPLTIFAGIPAKFVKNIPVD
nr:DapH/DapD/GlmU-related protein [Acinetobacter sp. ANC5681]